MAVDREKIAKEAKVSSAAAPAEEKRVTGKCHCGATGTHRVYGQNLTNPRWLCTTHFEALED